MAPEGLGPRPTRVLIAVALLMSGGAALAQDGPGSAASPRIFQCVLPDGRKVTSDKPIAECMVSGRAQRELNKDGSERGIVEAPATEDEKAERERVRRELDTARKEREIAARSDRDLIKRFPDEQAHAKARANALEVVRASVRNSEQRIQTLQKDRKPLTDEAEFYAVPGGPSKVASGAEARSPLPQRIRLALDANDAALEAQKSLVQNQAVEIARINARYDNELARLRKLWGGAVAGSLGPMPRATDPKPDK